MRYKGRKNFSEEELNDVGVLTKPVIITKDVKNGLNTKNIFLELGAGRGSFTITLAKQNPEAIIVALEKNKSFAYILAQSVLDHGIENIIVINDDVINLENWVMHNTISKIFLNFSDPWPKKRHHKRRLTYPNFLRLYNDLLKEKGIVQFRTDHLELFTDSIEYIEKDINFNILEIDYNLAPGSLYTDYEVVKRKKYKINQLIAEKNKDD